MVKVQNVAITTGIFIVTLLGHVVQASLEDVLTSLSTSELNSLLQNLEQEPLSGQGSLDYGQGQDYEGDYNNAADLMDDYVLPSDFKQVSQRSVGAVQPPTAASRSTAAAAAATAMLPAYCDPPNPCPPGYTSSDGCIDDFENSSEFSRDYQSTQNCICDTEHMFNCPANAANNQRANADTSFLSDLPGLNADGRENPFLGGQKLPIAAKKGMDF